MNQKEIEKKKKLLRRARVNNALVGSAAGAFLGGTVHGGKSGYAGARAGAVLGALYGGLSNPKKRAEIEKLQTASFATPASRVIEFRERTEQADRLKTAAIVASGTAGTAAGIYGAKAAREAGKAVKAFTPQSVVNAVGQGASGSVKKKVKEYFPTFTKWGKKAGGVLKKKVFSTPAQRLIDFGKSEQMRDYDKDTFASPLRVASGMQKAYYKKDGDGRKVVVDVPVRHAQVVNEAMNKAGSITKWGGRAGRLGKDAVAVVRGKPRERDIAGRQKKREWEKGWFKNTVAKGAVAGGLLGGAVILKKNKGARDAFTKYVNKGKKAVNRVMPDKFDLEARYATPAMKMFGEKRFKKVVVNAETGRKNTIPYGQAGKAKDGGDRIRPGTAKGDAYCARSAKIKGDWKDDPNSPNNLSRKKWKCVGSKSKRFETPAAAMFDFEAPAGKAVKKVAAPLFEIVNRKTGVVVGKATNKGSAQKVRDRRDNVHGGYVHAVRPIGGKQFETPASRLYHFDWDAEKAGWDVRDPRGRSARVFAPGSGKRDRREKRWHEKAENERKLWKAGVAAAGIAGLVAGRKLKVKKKVPVTTGAAPAAASSAGAKAAVPSGGYYRKPSERKASERWN